MHETLSGTTRITHEKAQPKRNVANIPEYLGTLSAPSSSLALLCVAVRLIKLALSSCVSLTKW